MSTRALAGYRDLADGARDAGGTIDQDGFARRLLDLAAGEYRRGVPSAQLMEFSHRPATYVFDDAGAPQAERTILAVAHPEPPAGAREVAYQRGYPLPDRFAGRAVDRGHFVPYTAGGLFGPNLFVQDRALNRGWSREGRAYRVLERAAVAGSPATVMFVRPLYVDDGDGQDALTIELAGATDAQIGAFGEETAAARGRGAMLCVGIDVTPAPTRTRCPWVPPSSAGARWRHGCALSCVPAGTQSARG